MGRTFREMAILVTEQHEDSTWHLVRGVIAPYAPDQELPLALDEQREYAFRWDGKHWVVLTRGAQTRASRARRTD